MENKTDKRNERKKEKREIKKTDGEKKGFRSQRGNVYSIKVLKWWKGGNRTIGCAKGEAGTANTAKGDISSGEQMQDKKNEEGYQRRVGIGGREEISDKGRIGVMRVSSEKASTRTSEPDREQ